MIPRKTELALTTLQSHRSPLTLLQRRALILADGQRDLATLATLLGGDGTGLVQSLCALGYLDLDPLQAVLRVKRARQPLPRCPMCTKPP